jgi:TolA-binding protein
MHPVLKSNMERGWKADPEERPTMAEICTELAETDWLVFDGADAGRVKREAARRPPSQSVSKAMLQALLSETQARICGLEREIATLESGVSTLNSEVLTVKQENSTLRWDNSERKAEVDGFRAAKQAGVQAPAKPIRAPVPPGANGAGGQGPPADLQPRARSCRQRGWVECSRRSTGNGRRRYRCALRAVVVCD